MDTTPEEPQTTVCPCPHCGADVSNYNPALAHNWYASCSKCSEAQILNNLQKELDKLQWDIERLVNEGAKEKVCESRLKYKERQYDVLNKKEAEYSQKYKTTFKEHWWKIHNTKPTGLSSSAVVPVVGGGSMGSGIVRQVVPEVRQETQPIVDENFQPVQENLNLHKETGEVINF